MSENPVHQILTTRPSTHGEFSRNSATAQDIKAAIRRGQNFATLQPFQAEALDLIASKIGRILDGDPDYQDHWDDIEGYAKLASDRTRAIPAKRFVQVTQLPGSISQPVYQDPDLLCPNPLSDAAGYFKSVHGKEGVCICGKKAGEHVRKPGSKIPLT